MNRFLIFILLLILPAFLFYNVVKVREYRGAFYSNSNYDPSYSYLISSLNLSRLKTTHYVDHPGIPPQIIGAAVVFLYFSFSGIESDISKDVLLHPEEYLNTIDNILAFICSISLFALGLMIYRSEKNVTTALLFQMAPFISFNIQYVLTLFTSDNFIVSVVLLFIGYSFLYMRKADDKTGKKFRKEILYGILCGAGIATKITFIPLLFIPYFIIPGVRKKMFFTLAAFTTIFVCFLPGILRLNYYFGFMKNLFIKSGQYGTGDSDFLNIALFISNLKEIISTQELLIISYLTILAVSISILINRFIINRKTFRLDIETKMLIAILFAMTLQIIISSKHYMARYLTPSLLLSIPGVYISFRIMLSFLNLKHSSFFRYALNLALIIVLLLLMENKFRTGKSAMEKNRNETLKIIEASERDFAGKKMIINFGSSSREYALNLGVSFGGNQKAYYKSILKDLYPDRYFFELWKKQIYSFSDSADLRKSLFSGDRVFLMSSDSEYNRTALEEIKKFLEEKLNLHNTQFEKIMSNNSGENIYEIRYQN